MTAEIKEEKNENVFDIEDTINNKAHEENMINKVLDKKRFVNKTF